MNMYLDELLNKNEYEAKKNDIKKSIASLEEKKGLYRPERGKRYISHTLGKNYILKDWILAIELEPWFKIIQKEYP